MDFKERNHSTAIIPLIISALFLLASLPFVSAEEWKELKGDHFIVFYRDDMEFAKDILKKSEYYYRHIASDLGFVRYDNFWRWENRVSIFLYPDKASFQTSENHPQWAQGYADYFKKSISGHSGSKTFLETILPHELTHLIFRDFVGFTGEIPLWLDEGVAQWQERKFKNQAVQGLTKELYERRRLMSLKRLMITDVQSIEDEERVERFYIQAASLVGFLIEEYGTDRFATFCRHLKSGKSLDASLRFTYPAHMRNVGELQDKWMKYVAEFEQRKK